MFLDTWFPFKQAVKTTLSLYYNSVFLAIKSCYVSNNFLLAQSADMKQHYHYF